MSKHPLPGELLQSLQHVPGYDQDAFVRVHRDAPVVSVRFNPGKIKRAPGEIFAGSRRIPWSSQGYYLPSRPSFTLDPLLHAGVYYVQEASSMFIEQCLSQTTDLSQPLRVLDLCAAPGGKSTLLQSLISNDSLLVSNEVIRSRINVLDENLSKWGGPNVIITNNDPKDFSRLENFFDVMVVDAPCSGSGLFRKDPDAIGEWSRGAVLMCAQRQERILADALPALKKGGLLVYSTCSYSAEENEAVCDWLLENFPLRSIPLTVPSSWNITETSSAIRGARGYRFFPYKTWGEGFFAACFVNGGSGERARVSSKKMKLLPLSASESAIVYPWLNTSSLQLFHQNEDVFAFPSAARDGLEAVLAALYIKKAGVTVGSLMKSELVPAHELAVSLVVNPQLLSISLNKEEALQYLRKQEVSIQGGKKGWAMVNYEGFPLGWLKLLGNRANNYYPKQWRILKSGSN